jgi:hypothetical protein
VTWLSISYTSVTVIIGTLPTVITLWSESRSLFTSVRSCLYRALSWGSWRDFTYNLWSILIRPRELSDHIWPAESSNSETGETSRINDRLILPTNHLFHTRRVYLICRKIFQHGADGFTSPPKEGELRIFIAFKNPSPSACSEPANFGSNDKHANH